MNMNKTKFVLPVAALGVAFLLSCSSSIDEVAKTQCAVTQGEWNEATKKCESCPPGTSKYDGQCVASAILLANGQYACPTGTTLNANKMCVADIIAVDPNTTPADSKFFCDYGRPHIEDREVFGDCWRINNQTERDTCSKYGKEVDACPTYSCPAGTARPAPGYACEIGAVQADKWCYYGKATDCWPIGSSGANEATEAICEANYGKVVTSCSGVVITYCDWGEPHIENGEVQGGCWSIKNATQERECSMYDGITRTSCPKYTCPSGTTKVTGSWAEAGEVGCILTGGNNNGGDDDSPFYCDYGYVHSSDADLQEDNGGGCFGIGSEDECDLEFGKLVNSCKSSDRRTDLEYCNYGRWNQWGGGCWPIRSDEDRANCNTQYAEIVPKCLWLNP